MNRDSLKLAMATLAVSAALSACGWAQATTKPGPEQTNNNSNAPTVGTGSEATSPSTRQETPSGSTGTTAAPSTGAAGSKTNPGNAPTGEAGAATTKTQSTTTPQNAGGSNANAVGAGASTANSEGNKTEQGRGSEKKDSTTQEPPSGAAPSSPEIPEGAPKTPRTEMSGAFGGVGDPKSADPLLEPEPLPANKATLIGGTAKKVDRIKNSVSLQPFGGGKQIRVHFDERSHIYRDGRETTIMNVRPGDRIYVDTQLVGSQIFARNLRVQSQSGPAEASGQIVAVDGNRNTVRMLDKLTNQTITFSLSPNTRLHTKGGEAKMSDLQPGTLASVVFAPGRRGGEAREIEIAAIPGASYLFAGRITSLDLRNGVIALDNESDGKNYEIRFNPASVEERESLGIGVEVAANSTFDGRGYQAKTLTITKPSQQPESAQQ